MIDYLKQNHLSILIIIFLLFSSFFGEAPVVQVIEEKLGALDSTTIGNPFIFTNTVTITGATVTDDFTQGGTVRASSTDAGGAAETLTEAEMIANSVFEYSGTYGAALSITLPATSTMTTLLASAGDTRRWVFDNQFTAAATTTTIVAGTGIILMGVTANDDVIDGGEVSELVCWRKSDTDVGCIISELVDAD